MLLSWDDAETLFHEFGHALHSLSSRVDYPTLNGGVRDYTEFQSQLLERWLLTDPVIRTYLVHHETGEPMPAALVAKIRKAATFNQGFETTEYLASALVDMRFHMVDPRGIDPDAFEREALTELQMPREIVMRHRSPQFTHVFSGEGYSAGYYGYLWADVSDLRRGGGVRASTRRLLRQGAGEEAGRQPLRGAQRGRPGRCLPRVPRPRRRDRCSDARPRLPGAGSGIDRREIPVAVEIEHVRRLAEFGSDLQAERHRPGGGIEADPASADGLAVRLRGGIVEPGVVERPPAAKRDTDVEG